MVGDGLYKQLLRDIRSVERSVPLGRFNALGVGGRAAYFAEVHDAMELAGAVKAATDAGLPYEVIGAGTSVLFSDEAYAGLVIWNRSEGFIMAADRSQVVVDSGMSLQRFITTAAGRGYGGMTQFYPLTGTVGGAVYHGVEIDGTSITSFIRHLTVLMPPTKMRPQPTISRQRGDWLKQEEGKTRLRRWREQRGFAQPQPVILNVQFQLTSVRPDELQRRIQQEAASLPPTPKGAAFGPLFREPGGNHVLADLLRYSGVVKLRAPGLKVDKRHLNYLQGKRDVTARGVWELVTAMQALVLERSGIEIVPEFERLGSWESPATLPDVVA